jgi:hypothetical protein
MIKGIIITLLILFSSSLSLSPLRQSSQSILQCSQHFNSNNLNGFLCITFAKISECLEISSDYIDEANWETAVEDGLQPLSQCLKEASLSDEIMIDDFKQNMFLASLNIAKACEITGCIVQASAGSEYIIDAGTNIVRAAEAYRISNKVAAEYIMNAGKSLSSFGSQLSTGKFTC